MQDTALPRFHDVFVTEWWRGFSALHWGFLLNAADGG